MAFDPLLNLVFVGLPLVLWRAMDRSVDELLQAVQQKPEDEGKRERAARALEAQGRPAEAVALLTERLVNLTAHEGPPLPCLCRQCLEPAQTRSEHGGMTFTRDFSVARGRVLFYWVPAQLVGDAARVRRSVAQVMDENLKPRRRR
jgi:hypothetical protein